MVCSCSLQLSDQPPQPPIVTFTSFWLVKNSPLLVFATAMMFWVAARRIRVDAAALPDIGEKMECRDAGIWIAIGDNENVTDIIIVGHRRVDRHGQRHRVAILGNLGKLD
jgi:hypothetical protein